jgi:hypothetical protein
VKQTIKIFLAEGNPTGIRTIESSNWNLKGYIIPRESVESLNNYSELVTQGIYLLVGENNEGERLIYIGESERLLDRIKSHAKDPKKTFWQQAICFFSKDSFLNKAHIKYLEEYLIQAIKDAGRISLENNNSGGATKLSMSDEADILNMVEQIKVLLATIGHTFLKKLNDYEKPSDLYELTSLSAAGLMNPTSEGYLVKEGSLFRKEVSQGSIGGYSDRERQKMLAENILVDHNSESYILTKDYLFGSPSNASSSLLGRSSNGWTSWKRVNDGKTLDEVERKLLEE